MELQDNNKKNIIRNHIYTGDCKEIMKTFPDECIDTVICSPPYWKIREYLEPGELGDEEFFEDFVENLCQIFDEVWRVLKSAGTLWVNLGDTYLVNSNYWDGKYEYKNSVLKKTTNGIRMKKNMEQGNEGSLCLIPHRFAIAMTSLASGRKWILKNEIIWYKRAGKPSSSYNKFVVNHELLFFFVKQRTDYYFKALRDPGSKSKMKTVWDILPTIGTRVKHSATFPTKFTDIMIESGCPNRICSKCGLPSKINADYVDKVYFRRIGYHQCECNEEWIKPIVMDPFAGSGTTLLSAVKNDRDFIGIEISPEFSKVAKKRVAGELEQTKLFNTYETETNKKE